MSALIKKIDKNSICSKIGIKIGDSLETINGKKVIDVLDYKFYAYDTNLTLEVKSDGVLKEFKVKKHEGQDIGLEFETYLMDKPKSCSNKCIFCFIDQLPKGMRKTLYFKDDDARLSFLLGNYISLTNLSEIDVERMIRMRVSPINVSVQTTNPWLRNHMLGNKKAGDSLLILKKFAEANLTMNCQLVICQGINDGYELEKSLHGLKGLYPSVNSISVVPAGLTKYRDKLEKLESITKDNAKNIIEITENFAKKCMEEFGTSLAFCGDELYIKAGLKLPETSYYEAFEQFENGVGMVSLFKEQFLDGVVDFENQQSESFTIATGSASFEFLTELIDKLNEKDKNINGNVIKIENEFFGHEVSVAGLITGRDLINGLKNEKLGSKVLITENMLRDGGDVFLDDLKIDDVEKELDTKVLPISIDGYALLEEIYRR